MHEHDRLDDLRAHGRMHWLNDAQAWRAEPDEVMRALADQGYQECPPSSSRSTASP